MTASDGPTMVRGNVVTRYDLAEDVDWLDRTGEDPQNWPKRTGRTAKSLATQLLRADRPDLARKIGRVVAEQRSEKAGRVYRPKLAQRIDA